tara:strand:+ start:213 stop:419 length:207 start_codon:yes stop_codon:yes gene_type:complete
MGNIIARAQGGRAQIVDTAAGVIQTFGVDVATAMLQGNEVVVTLTNGKTQIYRFNSSGRTVFGPVRTF